MLRSTRRVISSCLIRGLSTSLDTEIHRIVLPKTVNKYIRSAIESSCNVHNTSIRKVLDKLPVPQLYSQCKNIIYNNWVVPVENVEKFVPKELELDTFKTDGKEFTIFSVLSYKHGHFGPKFLGPLRNVCPSPIQSNWRLYLKSKNTEEIRPAVYFVKSNISSLPYVVGSRLFSNGLPAHYPDGMSHTVSAQPNAGVVRTVIRSRDGCSAPDYDSQSVTIEDKTLPEAFKARFEDWTSAVQYLIHQDKSYAVHKTGNQTRISESLIYLQFLDAILPQETTVTSEFLAPVIGDAQCFSFLCRNVNFHVDKEQWL